MDDPEAELQSQKVDKQNEKHNKESKKDEQHGSHQETGVNPDVSED